MREVLPVSVYEEPYEEVYGDEFGYEDYGFVDYLGDELGKELGFWLFPHRRKRCYWKWVRKRVRVCRWVPVRGRRLKRPRRLIKKNVVW